MTAAPRLFGTNGIRGIAGKDVNSRLAFRVGSALAVMFPGKRALVGRDGRLSSIMLSEGVAAGIMSQGSDVDDQSLITTPALEFTVRNSPSSVGVMITASHNPPEYNGFKIVDSDGIEIPRTKEEKMERLIYQDNWIIKRIPGRRFSSEGQLSSYLTSIESHFANKDKIKDLKIVVDTGNGVASLTTPVLLKRMGARVIAINDDINGNFPGRNSEPRPENLGALSNIVREQAADLGIAHDGDGDRAIFVDEKGTVQPGDRSLALIEDDLLRTRPGVKVVTPINTSMVVSEIAKRRRGELVLTKVGSIEVSRTIVKTGALLGGEENGGIFYEPHHPVRDGTMAAILIVNTLLKRNKSLSKLMNELPRFHMIKEKIPCPDKKKTRVIDTLKTRLRGRISSTLDGVKVSVDGKGSALIRASGTEPLLRLYVEAKTEKEAGKILEEFRPMIMKALK